MRKMIQLALVFAAASFCARAEGVAPLCAWSQHESPQVRALIVGVSDYQDDRINDLEGPKNDVLLFASQLDRLGVSEICVLADSLDQAAYPNVFGKRPAPTTRNIKSALRELAASSGPKDHAIIYLVGHGSYIPDRNRDEPDGFDEVFVPIDATYNPVSRSYERFLIDDEIQTYLRSIRAKGTDVWFINDSCNSSTSSRAQTGARARFVSPAALGMPTLTAGTQDASVTDHSQAPEDLGGNFAGFYAARSEQLTYEAGFPIRGGASDQTVHGIFTWHLVRALRQNRYGNYRELAQALSAGYFDWPYTPVSPVFDGHLSDAPPFVRSTGRNRLFALSRTPEGSVRLDAGLIDGVDSGSKVQLIVMAGTEPDVVGTARVRTAGNTRSQLDAFEFDAVGGENWLRESNIAALAARVRPDYSRFRTRIALQGLGDRSGQETSDAASLRERLIADGRFELVSTDEHPHATLIFAPEGVLASRYSNEISCIEASNEACPSIAGSVQRMSGEALTMEQIWQVLANIHKSRSLLSLAGRYSSDIGVNLHFAQRRPGGETCEPHDPEQAELMFRRGAWRKPSGPTGIAGHCDRVGIEITNPTNAPYDVTAFYIDDWANMYWLAYPWSEYGGLRLPARSTRWITFTENLDIAVTGNGPLGPVSIVVLAEPAERGSQSSKSYAWIASDDGPFARSDTSSAAELEGLIGDLLRSGAISSAADGVRSSQSAADAEIVVRSYTTTKDNRDW